MKKLLIVLAIVLLSAVIILIAIDTRSEPVNKTFMAHIDQLAPQLLDETNTPGAVIGIIENGELIYAKGFGFANRESQTPMLISTVFNVGSVSKLATAWVTMKLVEDEVLDPDVPVSTYIDDIEGLDLDQITIRHLLSHTAGLNMAAVPEYPSDAVIPDYLTAIDEVEQMQKPGLGKSYSGGGYLLLEYILTKVTGQRFEETLKQNLFEYLGMNQSSVVWTPELLKHAATPYDDGTEVDYFQYKGAAAAAVNSSLNDISNWVLEWLKTSGNGPVTEHGIDAMMTPQVNAEGQFGTQTGLAYNLWPLKESVLIGHNGQNTGWSSNVWSIPDKNSAIIVLTNSSDGDDFGKIILCDFMNWKAGTSYSVMCSRPGNIIPPFPSSEESRASFVEQDSDPDYAAIVTPYLKDFSENKGGGVVIQISRGDSVLFSQAEGLADAERNRTLTTKDAFYLASVSKVITAVAVIKLAEEGKLTLDDKISNYLELPPAFGNVTIKEALSHRSGIPDFWQLYQFKRDGGLDNNEVMELLESKPDLDFDPGSDFGYSNSNYILLSMLIEKISNQPASAFVRDQIFIPSGMTKSVVYEFPEMELPSRAHGYKGPDAIPFDYVTMKRNGKDEALEMYLTGPGGVYSTVGDLQKFSKALLNGLLIDKESFDLMTTPVSSQLPSEALPNRTGYGYGLEIMCIQDEKIIGHSGALFGFRSRFWVEPKSGLTITVLSNLSSFDAEGLANALLFASLSPR